MKGANGGGTIRKKEVVHNGKAYTYWEARITTGYDPGTGKQIQRSFSGKTQKEVREKMQAVACELNNGTYTNPSTLSVREWFDIWVNDYLGDIKVQTRTSYGAVVKNHIIPSLGAVKLQALTGTQIQNFYKKKQEEVSAKTVKNIHGILHKGLQQALELGYIKFNPSDACKIPRVEKKEIQPLDDVQIREFLQAIENTQYKRVYLVDLFTGMRQGEILGLPWDCVDFKKGTIRIRQQLILNREIKQYQLAPIKNDKPRTITVAPFVMDVLREQKSAQDQQRKAAGEYWEELGLVFTNDAGYPLRQATVRHEFKNIVRAIGLPDTRFHDLRHSYAVASLQAGDDIKTLQENLGHHTAAFTMDVYGHVSERMKQESANRMQQFIQGVKK